MMQPITSSQSKRFKSAVQLHRSRGRKKQNRIIVFGARTIERAINSGVVPNEIFFRAGSEHDAASLKIVKQLAGTPAAERDFYLLTPVLFETLCYGDQKDGVIMTATRPSTELQTLDVGCVDSVQSVPAKDSLIVVCEQIEKPGNLGGILRSADGSGVAAVLMADPLTDSFHPNSIRNSSGAAFAVPTANGSADAVIEWLADRGYRLMIATPDAEETFHEKNLRGHVAIVLGNEAGGVSAAFRTAADDSFRLPMLGVADSLNVSVTGAILMYESLRQRAL